jgi:hypothetical protein
VALFRLRPIGVHVCGSTLTAGFAPLDFYRHRIINFNVKVGLYKLGLGFRVWV